MPAMSGSFSGKIKLQSAIALSDQSDHELNLAEIGGTQKASDANWDHATITYWGITDLIKGKGTQRGYFTQVHAGGDRDWGTFEGKVAMSGASMTVEGAWQFTGGSGKFQGLTGNGTFETKMSSPGSVEASWKGSYELASAKAQVR